MDNRTIEEKVVKYLNKTIKDSDTLNVLIKDNEQAKRKRRYEITILSLNRELISRLFKYLFKYK